MMEEKKKGLSDGLEQFSRPSKLTKKIEYTKRGADRVDFVNESKKANEHRRRDTSK